MINLIIILTSVIDTILIGKFSSYVEYYFPISEPMNFGQAIMIVSIIAWILLNIISFIVVLSKQKRHIGTILIKIIVSSLLTQAGIVVMGIIVRICPVYMALKIISKIIYKIDIIKCILSILFIIAFMFVAKILVRIFQKINKK